MQVWVVLEEERNDEWTCWTVRGVCTGTYDDAADLARELGIQPYKTDIQESSLFTR